MGDNEIELSMELEVSVESDGCRFGGGGGGCGLGDDGTVLFVGIVASFIGFCGFSGFAPSLLSSPVLIDLMGLVGFGGMKGWLIFPAYLLVIWGTCNRKFTNPND